MNGCNGNTDSLIQNKEDAATDPADPAAALLSFWPMVMLTNHKVYSSSDHLRAHTTPILLLLSGHIHRQDHVLELSTPKPLAEWNKFPQQKLLFDSPQKQKK